MSYRDKALTKRAAIVFGMSISLVSYAPRLTAQENSPFNAGALSEIDSATEASKSSNRAEAKVAPNLLQVLRAKPRQDIAHSSLTNTMIISLDQKIQVNITGEISSSLKDAIKRLGGTVGPEDAATKTISAKIPASAIIPLAQKSDVKSLEATPKGTTNALGSSTSDDEGEIAHDAADARARFHVDGSGVVVCVISDSVDHLKEAQNAGSLGTVDVLKDQEGKGAGEGTAMLEIVHRLAPGAALKFAKGLDGDVGMAANIRSLAKAGCHIMVDDVSYFDESPFQDGRISLAVNEVTTAGVFYFSSAANSGNLKHRTSGTWEGDFLDGGAVKTKSGKEIGRYHKFRYPDGKYRLYDEVEASPITGQTVSSVDLFWTDPLHASKNDYSLYVLNADGSLSAPPVVGALQQDPYKTAPVKAKQKIVVVKSPRAEVRHLYIDTNRLTLKAATEGSTKGHNASGAERAFSVAAVNVPYPKARFVGGPHTQVADYSSDGPRHIYFNADGSPITPNKLLASGGRMLRKPDLAAADAVNTDVPAFAPFRGTSAAAPHAAAIAALVLSLKPRISAQEMRTALTSACLDIETPGYDVDSGCGILMPSAALQALTPNTSATSTVSDKKN